MIVLSTIFRKIKANYRRENPRWSRTVGDFLFITFYL